MKTVLITGASSGFGLETARYFLDRGWSVVATMRKPRADLLPASDRLKVVALDVTDPASIKAALAAAGPIDVLVNNAGVGESASLTDTTLEAWQRQFAVNATAAFLCTREVIDGMRERDEGRVVTVASTAGVVGARYTAAYTASKHAAVGLMRATAAELAGTRVTANAVCPAFVDTPMTRETVDRIMQRTGRGRGESLEALAGMSPLGRLLAPAEVADAILWLASSQAGAINGQTLILDGGGIQL
jgi:NAD(P)-dependent dehydrogenase (short-subunit alcohol dehydrogenase family)